MRQNSRISDTCTGSLTAVVNRTIGLAESQEDVSLGQVIGSFEQTGFAALVIVPATAVVTPLSGIPLFSSVCGLTIALLAIQWLVGRKQVWLPGWLQRRSLKGVTIYRAMMRIKPLAHWLDSHSNERLRLLFRRPFRMLLPLACLILGTLMPLLELVPFSSSLLGAAICLIAFSRLTRDGIYALLAMLPVGGALWGVTALV